MALSALHKDINFGVGDRVKVFQKIKDGEKTRSQVFEGMVMGIKGREENKSFTVRRIGEAQIGIERIFPLSSPNIEKIQLVKSGVKGVRHAKLYYTRDISKRQVEKIYSRVASKQSLAKQ